VAAILKQNQNECRDASPTATVACPDGTNLLALAQDELAVPDGPVPR
jgi:hypothetical protein